MSSSMHMHERPESQEVGSYLNIRVSHDPEGNVVTNIDTDFVPFLESAVIQDALSHALDMFKELAELQTAVAIYAREHGYDI